MLGTDEAIWNDLLTLLIHFPKKQTREQKKRLVLLCFGVKRRENANWARKNGEKRRKNAGRTVCSL